MNAHQLIESISETLLWEVVSAHIEQPRFLPEMLRDVGYLDNKDEIIQRVDGMEIMDSEPLLILYSVAENGRIYFGFEMPFVLIAKSGKEQLLRITAIAAGKCYIPDDNAVDWSAFDWDAMNKQELLAHKDLAEFFLLSFEDVECDYLNAV